MCRYIVDPPNEGVLLPVKGDNANKHQTKYKVSSHVYAFSKQFAQGSTKKQRSFDAAGPWQVLQKSNAKLEVSCKQTDMSGHPMFRAMYILAPEAYVDRVSCAFPSPSSLAVGGVAARPSVSAGTLATTESKAGDKVLCSYYEKTFGKQSIKNHTAKCAEMNGFHGWGRCKHEPVSDLADGFDDLDDDDELDNALQCHDSRKIAF